MGVSLSVALYIVNANMVRAKAVYLLNRISSCCITTAAGQRFENTAVPAAIAIVAMPIGV